MKYHSFESKRVQVLAGLMSKNKNVCYWGNATDRMLHEVSGVLTNNISVSGQVPYVHPKIMVDGVKEWGWGGGCCLVDHQSVLLQDTDNG